MKNVAEYQERLINKIREKGVEHIFRWFSEEIEGLAKAQVEDMVDDIAQGNPHVPTDLLAQLAEAWVLQNFLSEATAIKSPSSQVVATALANARVAEMSDRIRRGNYTNKPCPNLLITNTKLSTRRTELHDQANTSHPLLRPAVKL